MKTTLLASVSLPLVLAGSLLAGGCSKQAPQQSANPSQTQPAPNAPGEQAMNPSTAAPTQQPPLAAPQGAPSAAAPYQAAPSQQANSGYAPAPRPERPPVPVSLTILAGTHITVTTREELSTKTTQSGQTFTATVASPIVLHGATLIRAGSPATGTVVASKQQGRFKGSGELDLRLDSIRSGGQTYEVSTSSIDQVEKGKGKRTAGFALGGGGGGALIGGIAGGGKGALLGGLLGAGGGTAVNAFTGNKPVIVPAESNLTFRLERPVTVSR